MTKDGKKTGGRVKGVTNVLTRTLKDMILNALDTAGGEDYLVEQAQKNPVAFLTLVGKVLPQTVSGMGPNGEHVTEVRVTVSYKRPGSV